MISWYMVAADLWVFLLSCLTYRAFSGWGSCSYFNISEKGAQCGASGWEEHGVQ